MAVPAGVSPPPPSYVVLLHVVPDAGAVEVQLGAVGRLQGLAVLLLLEAPPLRPLLVQEAAEHRQRAQRHEDRRRHHTWEWGGVLANDGEG